jgi:predicted SnoaL-like aldol condensation-catalyzing enzyme
MSDFHSASPDELYTEHERRNRDVVLEFYAACMNQRDWTAASRHLGAEYREHDPQLADGPGGLRESLLLTHRDFPRSRTAINRVFVEGDMVAIHGRTDEGATRNGEARVDIFRLQDGRIVEHWGVIQPIPDSLPHSNTMF